MNDKFIHSHSLKWSIDIPNLDGTVSHCRDFVLTWIELSYYVAHIPEEFWLHGRFQEPLIIPSVEYMPWRYCYTTHCDIATFDPNYAYSSEEPFTPFTFYSYAEDLRWDQDNRFLYHRPSGLRVCTSRPYSVFKGACIQLYDAGILPETIQDLIDAVEEHTDLYFLDAVTFAEHFIDKVPLPHSVHFGLLNDSWSDVTLLS
ncbi:hypothetical protein PM082_023260 [Marasmius tenuissimus]|nr:hypothetical protein PM082_023260 [Marasmius tenuissimus]